MVIPCNLPERLELVAVSDTTEVYRYTDHQGEVARIWVGFEQGTLCITSRGLPEIPFDVTQWLLDRGRELRGGTDA